jgi:hypothetical protein
MSKVLVLYYSPTAISRQWRQSSPRGLGKPAPRSTSNAFPSSYRTRSRATRTQGRSGRSRREGRRPCRLRRDHHWRWHPVRTTIVADGQFPGPGRRSLGARSVTRKSRRGIHLNRHATWWAGNDAILDHHQSLALRHGDRRTRLRPCRSEDKYLDLELRRRS